jgi:hypothetical protein
LKSEEELSKAEFAEMVNLIKRYSITEMDQFDKWKFVTSRSEIFIDIGMKPAIENTEKTYTDISDVLD